MIGVRSALHEEEISECRSKDDKTYSRKQPQHNTNRRDLEGVEN